MALARISLISKAATGPKSRAVLNLTSTLDTINQGMFPGILLINAKRCHQLFKWWLEVCAVLYNLNGTGVGSARSQLLMRSTARYDA